MANDGIIDTVEGGFELYNDGNTTLGIAKRLKDEVDICCFSLLLAGVSSVAPGMAFGGWHRRETPGRDFLGPNPRLAIGAVRCLRGRAANC